jgi:hypothetical protein
MPIDGQLTADLRLPAYARDMLYVVTENASAQTRGKNGLFSLDVAPDGSLRLAWGAPNGPMLAIWEAIPQSLKLDWDGRVRIGGFIERLHALEVGGLEVIVIEVVGGPFAADYVGLPSLDDMRRGVFARPPDVEPLGKDQVYPFIVLAESNMAALAQDALVSGLSVDAYGALASDEGRWHEVVGLPLLLDRLTLLAP